MTTQTKKTDLFNLIALVFFTVFSVLLLAWLASIAPLWGDELDTIAPAYSPWRGSNSFWWQIGLYNANPPGDNFMLRLFVKSEFLAWLKLENPELFFRVPYILVYSFSGIAMFFCTSALTLSTGVGLVCSLLMLASHSVFFFAVETRFYIWLVLWMVIALGYFLNIIREETKQNLFFLALLICIGSSFHLMVMSLGYLLFGYVFFSELISKYTVREKVLRIIISFLPILYYKKIIVKRWVQILPMDPDFNFLASFKALSLSQLYQKSVLVLNPGLRGGLWLALLIIIFLFSLAAAIFLKRKKLIAQCSVLTIMFFLTPLYFYFATSARHYPVLERHLIYQVPIICFALGIFLKIVFELGIKLPSILRPLVTLSILTFTLSMVCVQAGHYRNDLPTKVSVAFNRFREVYRMVPDKRKLLIVGASPEYTAADTGLWLARTHMDLLNEFEPSYYSKNGFYNSKKTKVVQKISWVDFDLLLVGDLVELPRILKLPEGWKPSCRTFPPGNLAYCRF